jgi:hypothetical protein
MALTATCTSCGKRFRAPEALAGKLIECRGCGAVFSVPETDAEAEVASAPDRSSPPTASASASADDTASMQAIEDEGAGLSEVRGHARAPVSPASRRVEFYRSEAMEHIDRWAPPGLVLIGLLTVVLNTLAYADGAPGWLGWTRVLVALGLFAAVALPIAGLGLMIAARSTAAAKPRNTAWRLFASFFPAFAIAMPIWHVMGGVTGEVVFASAFGVVISGGLVILLFRLQGNQMVPVTSMACGGFVLGSVLCVALAGGLNYVANQLAATFKLTGVPASPIAHGLPWELVSESESGPPVPAPAPAARTTHSGSPGSTTVPARPAARGRYMTSPAVLTADEVQISGTYRTLLRPGTGPGMIAVIRGLEASNLPVEVWDAVRSRSSGRAVFAEPQAASDDALEAGYALSPDGGLLARVADFPRRSVQFWSYTSARVETARDLPPASDSAVRLLGFVDNTRLLYRLDSGNTRLRVVDSADAGALVSVDLDSALPRLDSVIAVDAFGTSVAIALRSSTGGHQILIHSLNRGTLTRRIAVSAISADRDTPPTGLTFSPDGSRIVAYYEQSPGGAALLVTYNTNNGDLVSEAAFPSSPLPPRGNLRFRGSSLLFFPDSKHLLLYGDAVLDASTGRMLGRLELPRVIGQRFVAGNVLELMLDAADPKLVRLTLDPGKLATTRP